MLIEIVVIFKDIKVLVQTFDPKNSSEDLADSSLPKAVKANSSGPRYEPIDQDADILPFETVKIDYELDFKKNLPLILKEYRIIDPNSEHSLKTEAALKAEVRKYAPEFADKLDQCKIYFSDDRSCNTGAFKGTNPAVILLNKGMFVGKESAGSFDFVIGLLMHEYEHHQVKSRTNSKLEEALADKAAILGLHDAGLSPLEYSRGIVRLSKNIATLRQIFDEHPELGVRLDACNIALTHLFLNHSKPQETPKVKLNATSKELLELIQNINYEDLAVVKKNENLSAAEKIQKFKEILNSPQDGKLSQAQYDTLNEIIKSKDIYEDNAAYSELINCYDQLVLKANQGDERLLDLCEKIEKKSEKYGVGDGTNSEMIGVLGKFEEQIKNFIKAKDLDLANSLATELKQKLDTYSASVLDYFSVKFELVKITEGKPLPWNSLVNLINASTDQNQKELICEVLLRLGIEDTRLFRVNSDLSIQNLINNAYSLNLEIPGRLSVTKHKIDPSEAIETILYPTEKSDLILISSNGVVLSVSEHNELNQLDQRLEAYQKIIFLNEYLILKNSELDLDKKSKILIELAFCFTEIKDYYFRTFGKDLDELNDYDEIKNKIFYDKEVLAQTQDLDIFLGLYDTQIAMSQEKQADFVAALESLSLKLHTIEAEKVVNSVTSFLGDTASSFMMFAMKISEELVENANLESEAKLNIPTLIKSIVNFVINLERIDIAGKYKEQVDQIYRAINESILSQFIKLESFDHVREVLQLFSESSRFRSITGMSSEFCRTGLCQDWNELDLLVNSGLFIRNERRKYFSLQVIHLSETTEPSFKQVINYWQKFRGRDLADQADDLVDGYIKRKLNDADLEDKVQHWKFSLEENKFSSNREATQKLKLIFDEIKNHQDANYQVNCLNQILQDKTASNVLVSNPNLRSEIQSLWAKQMAIILGQDDNTHNYRDNFEKNTDQALAKMNKLDRYEILKQLAEDVNAQRPVLKFIKTVLDQTLDKNYFDYSARFGSALDLILVEVRNNPIARGHLREFMLGDGSRQDSLELARFFTNRRISIDQETFDAIYQNYWAAGLEERAVITKQLLFPQYVGGSLNAMVDEYAENIWLVMERTFPEGSKNFEQFRIFTRALFDSFPSYAKYYAYSALLTASKQGGETNTSRFGHFLELLGPAPTKAGQAAASHPDLPADLRKDFKRLKTMASKPARWDLFDYIDSQIDISERSKYEYIGKIWGAGSFYISFEVKHADFEDRQMVRMLRPFAEARSDSGFELLNGAHDKLVKKYDYFRPLRQIIDAAAQDAKVEAKPHLAQDQYLAASRSYQGVKVCSTKNKSHEVTFKVPKLYAFGENFQRIEIMPGDHYDVENLDKMDPAQKDKYKFKAKAILTLEIANALSARGLDNDRHGGNVHIKDESIGHYDFGGIRTTKIEKEELQAFGQIIKPLIDRLGSRPENERQPTKINLSEIFYDRLKEVEGQGQEIPKLAKSFQKAALSLAEYAEILDDNDLKDVFTSAIYYAAPVVKKELLSVAQKVALRFSTPALEIRWPN